MNQKDKAGHPSGSLEELIDRERRLRKEIEEFKKRLQLRARDAKVDLATIRYPKVYRCNHPETKSARLACLYDETRPFSNERIVCNGERLGELEESHLVFYVDCVTQRHREGEGEERRSVRFQALQLKMITKSHAELETRIQKMQA